MAASHGDAGLDGILVLNKPAGPTSHDVVALVRRLSGTRRVGHGGTLDPFAAGVLPIFLGKATRMVEYHQADRKAYRATICFGATSTTDDLEGELTPVVGPAVTRDAVERGLAAMEGVVEQRPPAYSAIKVGGRRAYALARAGVAPVLALRTLTLHRLTLTGWDGSDQARPVAVVDVECSPGTYVRAIARDLGASLGSGAYLGALVRTASGSFRLEDALPLDELRAAAATGRVALERHLRPIDDGLDLLPEVPLTRDEVSDVLQGRFVRPAAGLPGGDPERPMRLVDPDGRLVAIGLRNAGRVVPTKVLVDLAHREIGKPLTGQEPGAASRPGAAAEAPGSGGGAPRVTAANSRPAVVPGIDALRPEHGRIFFVVGVFDGLHRGHLYLLEQLRRAAAERAARPGVITFDAHPDEILVGSAPPLLVDPDERLERLAAAGVEVTVVQHFDEALRTTTYQDFVARIASRVDLAGFLMTPDAAFGHQRAGTPATLGELGRTLGFEVEVVPVLAGEEGPIRSSEIRAAIAGGDLARAAAMLGREVAIVGRSGEGTDARGTNLAFELPVALPPDGAWRVLVELAGQPVPLRRRLLVGVRRARLEPAVEVAAGSRLRVRLPSEATPDTIRRS